MKSPNVPSDSRFVVAMDFLFRTKRASKRDVAAQIKKTVRTLDYWLTGERGIKKKSVDAICQALSTTEEDLLHLGQQIQAGVEEPVLPRQLPSVRNANGGSGVEGLISEWIEREVFPYPAETIDLLDILRRESKSFQQFCEKKKVI